MPAGSHGTDERAPLDLRVIRGGLLLQDADNQRDDPSTWRVVTTKQPTDQEWDDMIFGWEAVRHIKSNAIVLVKDRAILGTGSGQPNRVESVHIAFPDSIEAAVAAGVTAIVHPGGSMRDDAVNAAAEAAGVTMVVTGTRHFKH
jgi:phosphoribosylaminoimidazolecarboxamide formyltransferase/IMP cyclohydrolase